MISQERNDSETEINKCEKKLSWTRHRRLSKSTGLLGRKYEIETNYRCPKIIGELPKFDKSRLRSHKVMKKGKSSSSK